MKKSLVHRAVVVGGVLAGIAVLVYLMLLLFVYVMMVTSPEDRSQCRTEIKAIENALRVYRSDYGKFPEYGSCRLQTTGTGQTDADLTDTLRGYNTNANPRGFVYLDANEKSLGTNVVTASGGQGEAGAMYDPWGNLYQIAVAYQFNRTVAHADGENLSNRTVAVWSWGPNKTAHPDPHDKTHIRSWK